MTRSTLTKQKLRVTRPLIQREVGLVSFWRKRSQLEKLGWTNVTNATVKIESIKIRRTNLQIIKKGNFTRNRKTTSNSYKISEMKGFIIFAFKPNLFISSLLQPEVYNFVNFITVQPIVRDVTTIY